LKWEYTSSYKRRLSQVGVVIWKNSYFEWSFHDPNVRKKLASSALLYQNNYTLIIGSNKIIIGIFGYYAIKCYLFNGLYKLSLMSSTNTTLQFLFSSIASVECCDSSYSMSGHLNFNTIKKMMHLNLIFKLHINRKGKKM
jgi:hypothetical protein